MTTADRITELEAELKQLRQQQREEQEAARKAVSPTYRFTLTPAESSGFDRIVDPSCELWRLTGTVTNREELVAVGASVHEGGMNYLFNTLSGRFVLVVGGGQVWLHLSGDTVWGREAHTEAFAELEAFVVANPEGGDVTDIVSRHRS